MGIDPLPDFPGEWALLALGYTQPLQHFHSHLVMNRVVQLNFIPEIEISYKMFERPLAIFCMTSLKRHMKYFNFRHKIQLDLPIWADGNLVECARARCKVVKHLNQSQTSQLPEEMSRSVKVSMHCWSGNPTFKLMSSNLCQVNVTNPYSTKLSREVVW